MNPELIARARLCLLAVLIGLAACSAHDLAGEAAEAADAAAARPCPEPRTTPRAPESYERRVNPLAATAQNLERGHQLYQRNARPEACANCHGVKGDGQGPASVGLVPPPRNFSCAATMSGLSDGQLYWVIENGSGEFHLPTRQGAQRVERPGRGTRSTAMRGYGSQLTSTEIWQVILYIRTLETTTTEGQQP